jgi:hypothetical protein
LESGGVEIRLVISVARRAVEKLERIPA